MANPAVAEDDDDDDEPHRIGAPRSKGERNLELSANYSHYAATDERTATAAKPELSSKEERAAAATAVKGKGGSSWLGGAKKGSQELASVSESEAADDAPDLVSPLPHKKAAASKKRFSLNLMDMGIGSKKTADGGGGRGGGGGGGGGRPGVVRRQSSTTQIAEGVLAQPEVAVPVGSRVELTRTFTSGLGRLGPRMSALDFVRRIPAQPFGVLGAKLSAATGKVEECGPDPLCLVSCCVVTPESKDILLLGGGPKRALEEYPSGSAAAVYRWLGIEGDTEFSPEVTKALQRTGDAAFKAYATTTLEAGRAEADEAHVIHVLSPNLGKAPGPFKPTWTRAEAMAALATAYRNVFLQFSESGQTLLRLPPISGGNFAGPFLGEMPALTLGAMQVAFDGLDLEERGPLVMGEVHLCLFNEAEHAAFVTAGFRAPNEAGPVLSAEHKAAARRETRAAKAQLRQEVAEAKQEMEREQRASRVQEAEGDAGGGGGGGGGGGAPAHRRLSALEMDAKVAADVESEFAQAARDMEAAAVVLQAAGRRRIGANRASAMLAGQRAAELDLFGPPQPLEAPLHPLAFLSTVVKLQGFGVLGQAMGSGGAVRPDAGPGPAQVDGCVIVDPIGLQNLVVSGGPAAAVLEFPQGAAAAIYRHVGIDAAASFPPQVVAAIQVTGAAKHHAYPGAPIGSGSGSACQHHVIHVAGPDFRKPRGPFLPEYTRAGAVEALGGAYANVLAEFVACGQRVLRLPPVSGGNFSGKFAPEVAALTWEALERGYAQLPLASQFALAHKEVHLCIFAEAELESFAVSFPHARADALAFAQAMPLLPFGVLGQQLLETGKVNAKAGPDPATLPGVVVLDPAGLDYIQQGPSAAGGAAGALYKWLGIAHDERFPQDVVDAVKCTSQAKYHAYSRAKDAPARTLHVIHAVGPDYRRKYDADSVPEYSEACAVESLADTYFNVFVEFVACGQPALRLLPVSGGIFSGKYARDIPRFTFECVQLALTRLSPTEQQAVVSRDVSLCIFSQTELELFEQAGFAKPGAEKTKQAKAARKALTARFASRAAATSPLDLLSPAVSPSPSSAKKVSSEAKSPAGAVGKRSLRPASPRPASPRPASPRLGKTPPGKLSLKSPSGRVSPTGPSPSPSPSARPANPRPGSPRAAAGAKGKPKPPPPKPAPKTAAAKMDDSLSKNPEARPEKGARISGGSSV